jgi:hypothetical protein
MNDLLPLGTDAHLDRTAPDAHWFARGLAVFAGATPLLIVAYACAVTADPVLRAQIVGGGLQRLIALIGAALAARLVHRLGAQASRGLVPRAAAAEAWAGGRAERRADDRAAPQGGAPQAA